MNAGKYAAGGCGLVMMESTRVERRGCGTVGDPGLWRDEFIPGLKRVTDFARKRGADPDFAGVPPAYGFWLNKRAKSKFEGTPSTYGRGLEDAAG
jgi:hypothetical protein